MQPQTHQNYRTPPINAGLIELIRAKREWSWKPSQEQLRKGFLGWHQRGYLAHFDAPNVTQIVTLVLADSFPATRRAEWEPILHEGDDSVKRRKLEAWLDRGYGKCWLRRPEVAELVEQTLLGADGHDYRLQAWVIMPNHVHLNKAIRYIEQNPVKACLVRDSRQWRWSSARRRDQYERLACGETRSAHGLQPAAPNGVERA
jgi:hypothetical protein